MAEPTLYLFDGFNLLHAGGFDSPEELRDVLASWVAAKGVRGIVVFDGHGADEQHGPLEVRWAENADTVIERLAAELRPRGAGGGRLLGRGRARHVRRRGAEALVAVVPARARARPRTSEPARRHARPARRGHAGRARAAAPRRLTEHLFVSGWVHCKRGCKTWTRCYVLPQLQGESSAREMWCRRRKRPQKTRGPSLSARTAPAYSPQKAQRELEDLQLVMKARNGDNGAMDVLMRRYHGFVRLKASSYFLAGGDGEDLIQEGLIGLYKAVRDFRPDKETSFRSFAELCVTRQIITAIKTATRFKHAPLNTYVSFSHTPRARSPRASARSATRSRARPCTSRRSASSRRRSSRASSSASAAALAARGGRASPLSRGLVLRGDGGAARVRHEDDRQRPAAREAQDHHAPEGPRSPPVASPRYAARCAPE